MTDNNIPDNPPHDTSEEKNNNSETRLHKFTRTICYYFFLLIIGLFIGFAIPITHDLYVLHSKNPLIAIREKKNELIDHKSKIDKGQKICNELTDILIKLKPIANTTLNDYITLNSKILNYQVEINNLHYKFTNPLNQYFRETKLLIKKGLNRVEAKLGYPTLIIKEDSSINANSSRHNNQYLILSYYNPKNVEWKNEEYFSNNPVRYLRFKLEGNDKNCYYEIPLEELTPITASKD